MNKIRWGFSGQLNCQSLLLIIFILNSIFPYSKECKIHLCKNTGSVTSTAFLLLKKFLSPIGKKNNPKGENKKNKGNLSALCLYYAEALLHHLIKKQVVLQGI